MNPYREVYDAVLQTIRTNSALSSLLTFVPIGDVNLMGTERRPLADDVENKLRVALVPLGGKLDNISSSNSRATEQYLLKSIKGSISLEAILDLKWLLLKAFWKDRSLGLYYVENVDVLTVTDESMIGTGAVNEGKGPSVTWQVSLVIVVRFLLNRTTLPMS